MEDMPDSVLIVVDSFGGQIDAEMAKSALESAGIESMIQSDSAGGMRPHLAWAGGGFKLLVRAEDEEAARKVLEPMGDVK
jgi:hypothetical protein